MAQNSNDQRANSLNPNNRSFQSSLDNRSVQLNTNQPKIVANDVKKSKS